MKLKELIEILEARRNHILSHQSEEPDALVFVFPKKDGMYKGGELYDLSIDDIDFHENGRDHDDVKIDVEVSIDHYFPAKP